MEKNENSENKYIKKIRLIFRLFDEMRKNEEYDGILAPYIANEVLLEVIRQGNPSAIEDEAKRMANQNEEDAMANYVLFLSSNGFFKGYVEDESMSMWYNNALGYADSSMRDILDFDYKFMKFSHKNRFMLQMGYMLRTGRYRDIYPLLSEAEFARESFYEEVFLELVSSFLQMKGLSWYQRLLYGILFHMTSILAFDDEDTAEKIMSSLLQRGFLAENPLAAYTVLSLSGEISVRMLQYAAQSLSLRTVSRSMCLSYYRLFLPFFSEFDSVGNSHYEDLLNEAVASKQKPLRRSTAENLLYSICVRTLSVPYLSKEECRFDEKLLVREENSSFSKPQFYGLRARYLLSLAISGLREDSESLFSEAYGLLRDAIWEDKDMTLYPLILDAAFGMKDKNRKKECFRELYEMASDLKAEKNEMGYYMDAVLKYYCISDTDFEISKDMEDCHIEARDIAQKGMEYSLYGYLEFLIFKWDNLNITSDNMDVYSYPYLRKYSYMYVLYSRSLPLYAGGRLLVPSDADYLYGVFRHERNLGNTVLLDDLYDLLANTCYKASVSEYADFKEHRDKELQRAEKEAKDKEKKESKRKEKKTSDDTIMDKVFSFLPAMDGKINDVFYMHTGYHEDAIVGNKNYATMTILLYFILNFIKNAYSSNNGIKVCCFIFGMILSIMGIRAAVKCFPSPHSYRRSAMLALFLTSLVFEPVDFLAGLLDITGYFYYGVSGVSNLLSVIPSLVLSIIHYVMIILYYLTPAFLLPLIWIRKIPYLEKNSQIVGSLLALMTSLFGAVVLYDGCYSFIRLMLFFTFLAGNYGFKDSKRRSYLWYSILGLVCSLLMGFAYLLTKGSGGTMVTIFYYFGEIFFALSFMVSFINLFAGHIYDHCAPRPSGVQGRTSGPLSVILAGFSIALMLSLLGLCYFSGLDLVGGMFYGYSVAARIHLTVLFVILILNAIFGAADLPPFWYVLNLLGTIGYVIYLHVLHSNSGILTFSSLFENKTSTTLFLSSIGILLLLLLELIYMNTRVKKR